MKLNNVLTWTNATSDNLWFTSTNWSWTYAGDSGHKAFVPGDIVNLSSGGTTGITAPTLTLALADTATASAIYINGPSNYTLTPTTGGAGGTAAALVTATGIGDIATGTAATGKLHLGKNADDANTITTTAFTGTLDLTALTGTNTFAQGIEITTGALRVKNTAQLGATLSNITFAPDATGALIIAGDILLDGAGLAAANRLSLTTRASATLALEAGKTLTFANNTPGANGGALSVSNTARLTLDATPGSQFIFTNNTANTNGGAISLTTGATLLLLGGTNGGSFTFTSNTVTTRGGAIDISSAAATIDHATFTSNKAASGQNGGAIANVTGTLNLTHALITTGTANNGAGIFLNTSATAYVESATLRANAAGALGGAIGIQGSSTMTLRDMLIDSNTSVNGGGIGLSGANNTLALTDVTLVNNIATTRGGALDISGTANLSINVSAGSTAQIAGNKSGATPAPNAITFNGTVTSTLTINTAPGATLDMLDPMLTNGVATLAITKTGSGAWNLGGTGTLGNATSTVNFNVTAGTLRLLGNNHASTGPGGAFTTTAPATLTLLGTSTFTLAPAATLAAAPGATLAAPFINLNAASIISLDLLNATPGGATPSILTLNATAATGLNPANWNLTISLLNAPAPGILNTGDTINLITLGSSKTFANIDLLNLANTPDPALYHLRLDPSNASTLQLYYGAITLANNVLTWTGANNAAWTGPASWSLTSNLATNATAAKGDIINLADTPATTTAPLTINIDAPANVAGIAVSGSGNYTLAGNAIVTNPAGSAYTGSAAATGALTLGAISPADASALTTLPYTGTLTLSNTTGGPNNFMNGIVINTGALVGNDQTLAIGASATITLSSQASLTFDQATTATYTAPLISTTPGAGSLTKTGPGALTLTANNSTFTGTTTIASGKLLLGISGAAANASATGSAGILPALGGQVQVAGGATFGGTGTAGSVTLAPAATLQIDTLTLSSLALSANSILNYTTLATTSPLTLTGPITQNTAGPATINLALTTLATGSYALITAPTLATLNPALFGITWKDTPLALNDNYLLTTDATRLWLTILAPPDIANNILTWTNASGNNAWLASPNWLPSGTAPAKNFLQADIVNIVGGASSSPTPTETITLAATATASAIYIAGTATYAITGPGALVTSTGVGDYANPAANPAATGRLVLGKTATSSTNAATAAPFTGTLDLTGQTGPANNFTQGIEINTGALRVATTAQLGAPLSLLNFAGTGTLIVAGTMLFDSAGAATNRLNIPASAKAAILLETGKTLTFANNNITAAGAALTISSNATLTLAAAPGAQYVFANNTSGTNAGAISLASGATLTLASARLTGNSATQNGGAMHLGGGATVNLDNVTIKGNSASTNGGAISTAGGSSGSPITISATLTRFSFDGNAAPNGTGGALFVTTWVTMNAAFTSGTFTNNTTGAGNGGAALYLNADSTFNGAFTNVLFSSNTSAGNAGVFGANSRGVLNLTLNDTSIVNNTAIANGGVAWLNTNAILNLAYNISAGLTSQVAGNKNGATGAANSIYAGGAVTGAITVNVGAGGSLDWLDPMSFNNASVVALAKNGPGVWNLGGAHSLGNASANGMKFTVNAGTLHLYGTGETSTGPAGSFSATAAALSIPAGSFTVGPGAALGAGGRGAQLTVSSLTLDPASLFSFDLSSASSGTAAANTLLTLSITGAASINNWSQTINLIGLDELDRSTNVTYTLLSLVTGNIGTSNPFNDNSFGRLANVTGLIDGYSLSLPTPTTLVLSYTASALGNHVLNWTGANSNTWYGARNWFSGTATVTPYTPGDIVNLANPGGTTSVSSTIVTPATGALVAGMYVSGTQNYTITGTTPITTSATAAATFAGFAAATGKLILGAQATAITATTTDPDTGGITVTTTNALVTPAPYTGALTLLNTSNYFENGIVIHSGALTGNAASLATGPAGIENNGSLTFRQTTNDTYASPLTGTGSLLKTGTGILTLTNPAAGGNTLSGPTTIQAGGIRLDNSSLGGDVTLAPNTTFGGAGAVGGSLTAANDTLLQVSAGRDTGRALSIAGDLTLTGPVTINYANADNTLHIGGAITQTATVTINFDQFKEGTYNIGNIGALNATVTVGNEPQYPDARQQTKLAPSGTDMFAIGFGDVSRILHWTGATGTTWALTGSNWIDTNAAGATGTTAVFGIGDRVIFDDITPNPPRTVDITRVKGAPVSDMILNTPSSYTITGYGITSDATSLIPGVLSPATATGKLTLAPTNTGTLTLANNGNDFTNGIDILGGRLAISGSTHAGGISNVAPGATLQISRGGNLITDMLALAASSTITAGATGRGTITGNITLAGMVEANIPASGTLRLQTRMADDNTITGPGAFRKTGAGELELTGFGALGNTGITQIDEGTVRLDGASSYSSNYVLSIATTIAINNGGLILANGTSTVNYTTAFNWLGLHIIPGPTAATTGTITGVNDILHITSGTFAPQLSGGLHIAVDAPGATAELGNLANNFTGAIIVNTGTFRVTDILQTGSNNTGTKVALNGGVLQISATDAPAYRGNIDVRANAPGIISVDPGVSSTWANITGPAAMISATAIKTGPGTLTILTAMNASELIIDQGRMVVQASTNGTPRALTNSFGGPITINAGATLQLGLAPAAGVSGTLGYFAGKGPSAYFIPTAAGIISSPIMGDGTLEINTGAPTRLNLTNPRSTIANLNIIGPDTAVGIQALTFAPTGTITVDAAKLILTAANAQTLGNIVLNNNAAFGFLRTGTQKPAITDIGGAVTTPATYAPLGPPNKRATIASLASTDATAGIPNLWFNVDITNAVADHLAITGAITGTFAVNIVNYSGTVSPTNAVNLELIHAPALAASGAFIIADNSKTFDVGLYKYTTTATTTPAGDYSVAITGRGGMSNTAAAIYSAAAAIPIAWFAEMDSVTQRMGDLHLETRNSKLGTRNSASLSLWMRGFDEKLNFNDKLYNKQYTGSDFTQNQYGAEAGVDYQVGDDTTKVYLGAYVGYGESYRAHDTPGTSQTDTAYGGIYVTAASKTGWYADIVAKFDNIKNQLTITDPATGQNPHADYRNWAMGASLEFGKNQQLPYGWYVEPQAQLAITAISGVTYTTNTGITAQRLMGTAARGRAGFRFGRDFETEKLGIISAYLKGYYGRQWATNGQLAITTPDGASATLDPALRGITLTGGAGLAWLFTKSTQVYFDYEITQARHYIKPYGLNLGIRHCW